MSTFGWLVVVVLCAASAVFIVGMLLDGLVVTDGASIAESETPDPAPPYALGEEFRVLGVTLVCIGHGYSDGYDWRPGILALYRDGRGRLAERFFPPCEWAALPSRDAP